ncbi:MAG TPA: CrcB family protein [Pseudonocardiaceae bacterium]|nr:CrcB family protein [Pseudonocardiaceae bacterium]
MRPRLDVLGVVAAGGVAGTLARHAATVVLGASPLVTFAVNVVGCLLIGVLTGLMNQVWAGRLLRPFLGTGVLGGFTTFSGYAIDAQQLLAAGRFVVAVVYVGGTVVSALVAVSIGTALTRASIIARMRV